MVLQCSLAQSKAGVLPFLAVVCLLIAAVLHFYITPQFAARASLRELQLSVLRTSNAPRAKSVLVTERYAEFKERLAQPDARGELLKSIFNIASEAGVSLTQADYRWQQLDECSCQQWQINLPVRGTYPQIRAFIDNALVNIAPLSLDEMTLRRDTVKSTKLEAHLRFSFYFWSQN